MKIKPRETVNQYNNNHLHLVYIHIFPKWLQKLIFLWKGVYNGRSSFKASRILCLFNKHRWGPFKYGTLEGKTFYYQCNRCGFLSEKIINKL
jgi:hypothetical protein